MTRLLALRPPPGAPLQVRSRAATRSGAPTALRVSHLERRSDSAPTLERQRSAVLQQKVKLLEPMKNEGFNLIFGLWSSEHWFPTTVELQYGCSYSTEFTVAWLGLLDKRDKNVQCRPEFFYGAKLGENRVKWASNPIFMKVGVKLIRKIQMPSGLTPRTGCRRPQVLRIPHIQIPIWKNCL